MMIEMKFGRPVIAWGNDERYTDKGRYIIYNQSAVNPTHIVLCDGEIVHYLHVKPDPEAPPMNGDEVEVSNNAVAYMPQYYRYIGQRDDGLHTVEQNGIESIFRHVRHPQPSKRERVIDIITNIQFDSDPGDVADEILKITEDE